MFNYNVILSVHCFNALQEDQKCIDLEVSYYMRCETKVRPSKLHTQNKRQNNQLSCPKLESTHITLPYRMNANISSEPIVNDEILDDFGMIRLYNKTCSYSTFYRRRCGHMKYYRTTSMTADECLKKCLENDKCHRAQYFPGKAIWASIDIPVCFLFPLGVRECQWAGGETMSEFDPEIKSQIKMIDCTRPKCNGHKDNCLHATSQGTWFDAWCDYNWLFDKGLYHYECNSCEYFFEPEDCKNSISCLSSCFGILTLPILQARLIRPKPENFNLPSDYKYVLTTWGSFFYKYYGDETIVKRIDAQNLCQSENASLPVPLSNDENKFLLTLGMRYNWLAVQVQRKIWLGISTKDQEWTTNDGNIVTWFNWGKNRPLNSLSDEIGVTLGHDEKWYDRTSKQEGYVVCWKIYERYSTE